MKGPGDKPAAANRQGPSPLPSPRVSEGDALSAAEPLSVWVKSAHEARPGKHQPTQTINNPLRIRRSILPQDKLASAPKFI